uniref:Uncharacterized protein n=1 Tax=Meloidogyne enterolobii TaxID=390850 RepID=A0A6V7U3D0_MELEN|nr:unnamed protein product [Meloidogyne enterolobii]
MVVPFRSCNKNAQQYSLFLMIFRYKRHSLFLGNNCSTGKGGEILQQSS